MGIWNIVRNMRSGARRDSMKWRDSWHIVALVALVCLCMSAISCCPCRKAGATTIVEVQRDSVYITHYDTLRVVERDTMWMQRIEQSHDRVMTKADTSYLENAYCESTASVDTLGILTHTLDTKEYAMLPVRYIERERVVRDTIYHYKDSTNTTERNETIITEVKKVAWYDKALRWVSLGLLCVVLWQNRKLFIKFLKLWI